MEEHDEWLSIDEVAAQLRVDRRTIARLIKAEQLQASKVGWQWRIKRSELERYLGREPKTA